LGSFAAGELVARAFSHGELVATHSLRTPGKAARLEVEADSPEVVADGADLTRVVVYAVDENGTACPYEDRRIMIQVPNGRFLGETPVHLEGGRIAFYAGARLGSTGPVLIRATAEGLQPGETQIAATPFGGAMVPLGDFDVESIQRLKLKGRW
jgi:beta-galactosidase